MAISAPGVPGTENDPILSSKVMARALSEETAASFAERGVRIIIVRLPQVHNTERQGLVTYAIQIAREKGVSAYVGDGCNRWPAAHRLDVARLYRLALGKGTAAIYHAVAEEGVSAKEIFEAVGKSLNVPVVSLTPEEAQGHFGWLAMFVGRDIPASSAITRKALGWEPTGPGMIEDLRNMRYA
jgi:nucleoside-diphosphate-sugar epimerase